ncbi:MAG: hypothetical protein ACT4TC_14595 [Myxococcaceae bacterium]
MTSNTFVVISLVALTGCLSFDPNGRYACDDEGGGECAASSDGGPGNFPLPDGGIAPPDPNAVTGVRAQRLINDKGEQVVPYDISREVIAAYLSSGSSWTTLTGVGTTDGRFSVSGVPPGVSYWMRMDFIYVLSTERAFDLSIINWGRVGTGNVSLGGTAVNLSNVTDTQPWDANDLLQLASMGSGLFIFNPPTVIATGATAFSQTISFTQGRDVLIDAAKGDRLEVSKLTLNTNNGVPYNTLLRTLRSPVGFSMVDGQSRDLSGLSFTAPSTFSSTFDWRRSELAMHGVTAVPAPGPMGTNAAYLQVRALPRGATRGWYQDGPILMNAFNSDGSADINFTATYANPFEGTDLLCWTGIYFRTSYTLGSATAYSDSAKIFTYDTVAASSAGPLRAKMTPVRNVRLNNTSLSAPLTGTGIDPSLAWDPPAVGMPTLYFILVNELRNADGRTTSVFVNTLVTNTTQITLPPGVLQLGKTYYLRIIAQSDTATSLVKPFDSSNPRFFAETLTATLTP